MVGEQKYCRYEGAGDQYCGKNLSSLPLFFFRFAVLSLQIRLNESENEAHERLILILFPDKPNDLWSIVKYGIV